MSLDAFCFWALLFLFGFGSTLVVCKRNGRARASHINEIYCTFACVHSLDLFMVKPHWYLREWQLLSISLSYITPHMLARVSVYVLDPLFCYRSTLFLVINGINKRSWFFSSLDYGPIFAFFCSIPCDLVQLYRSVLSIYDRCIFTTQKNENEFKSHLLEFLLILIL